MISNDEWKWGYLKIDFMICFYMFTLTQSVSIDM